MQDDQRRRVYVTGARYGQELADRRKSERRAHRKSERRARFNVPVVDLLAFADAGGEGFLAAADRRKSEREALGKGR